MAATRSVLLFLAATCALVGAVRLPSFIGSGMVLQRNVPARLFGWETVANKVTISFLGQQFVATPDAQGWWNVSLPPQPNSGPYEIDITPSIGASIKLTDVVFGDVVVCSGQSNMELGIIATVDQAATLAAASQYSNNIRVLQVANLDSYGNVSSPQLDFTVSQPWARSSASNLPYFSALCYFYAVELLKTEVSPIAYFGLIDSSWGGTLMEPWMDPDSLHACGEGDFSSTTSQGNTNTDFTLPSFLRTPQPHPKRKSDNQASGPSAKREVGGVPSKPSTLFNSMIAPLVRTPIRTVLWYQGESNAGNPVAYARCFPSFIVGWRRQWYQGTGGSTDPDLPFVFVQISSWPSLDNGMIATQRWAQMAALSLPKVGMAVSADLGDPASPFHPIHPPWKAEVARRVSISALNVVYGNTQYPRFGPKLTQVYVDDWSVSWGDYHLGFGSGVCGAGSGFLCLGIRLVFDEPLNITSTYGLNYGYPSGFELFDRTGNVFQPATLTTILNENTVQLNATWVWYGSNGRPTVLRYAWHDYPSMFLFNGDGQPVPPFNASLV
eukprot:m.221182 g.221182  ORF g.221182 m.221182 type:complete len:553 (-) comp15737_c0_seq1:659-2317(-)